MQRKEKRNRIIIIFGILLLLMGVGLFTTSFLCNYFSNQKEEELIDDFIDNSSKKNVDLIITTEEEKQVEVAPIQYSMILEIPKMKLKKGLYDIKSKYNNVDYNIEIIEKSDMPNVISGNLILAGHNGNANVSYFDNLNTLAKGDQVFIYYEGTKFTYKIVSNYEVKKDGTLSIKRDKNKTTITLISCKKNTKDKQIVYIGEQVDSYVY